MEGVAEGRGRGLVFSSWFAKEEEQESLVTKKCVDRRALAHEERGADTFSGDMSNNGHT